MELFFIVMMKNNSIVSLIANTYANTTEIRVSTAYYGIITHSKYEWISPAETKIKLHYRGSYILICGTFNPNSPGGGCNHHPLSENHNFFGAEHPLDVRPVSKFVFVHCGPVENPPSALSFSV